MRLYISHQISIVDLEGLNDAPFFELVKQKLLEAPWNLNVYESSTLKVRTAQITEAQIMFLTVNILVTMQ